MTKGDRSQRYGPRGVSHVNRNELISPFRGVFIAKKGRSTHKTMVGSMG
jgi:hypothetical protein